MKKKEKVNFITVKELSNELRITVSHIYTLARNKRIPFTKLGGKLLFDEKKIKDWVSAQSQEVEK